MEIILTLIIKKEINELKKDKEKLQREVQNEQQSRLMEYHTP